MSLIKDFSNSSKSSVEILKFIVNNRMKLYSLLKHITWDDMLNGKIILTEDMVDREIKPLILIELEKSIRVSKMDILFKNGVIHIVIKGKYGLFSFGANIFMEIEGFEFYPGRHLITLNYREEINSVLGFNNEKWMKVVRDIIYGVIKNSFTQKGLNGQPGIIVDNKRIVIDIDSIPKFTGLYKKEFTNALLSTANIVFMNCDDGKLVFKLDFTFSKKVKDGEEIASTQTGDGE